jgi:isopentenyl-diphosphate delta-isomerase
MTDQPRDESSRTSSRKRDHVELVVGRDVRFRSKSTGLEQFELEHNALPELNLADVDTSIDFLGRRCAMPVIISSMTGGYSEAEEINRGLSEVCQDLRIAMGVGSQRQMISSDAFLESYRVVRRTAPDIPIFGNIGAAEIVNKSGVDVIRRLADAIGADGFAVHLNPLQEMLQPEGSPEFSGVLAAIESLVVQLVIPIIVKEVGAGLSASVVARLLDVGVRYIDVSGAGGTSWSGVEILRGEENKLIEESFWDWGIPTSDALIGARELCEKRGATLIASGGIASPRDVAIAIALGAHCCGAARPFLAVLMETGAEGLHRLLVEWRDIIRGMLFLTGSADVATLRNARVVRRMIA